MTSNFDSTFTSVSASVSNRIYEHHKLNSCQCFHQNSRGRTSMHYIAGTPTTWTIITLVYLSSALNTQDKQGGSTFLQLLVSYIYSMEILRNYRLLIFIDNFNKL